VAGFSKYQQDLIRRYYEQRGDIMMQKLGELVGEIYLCDSPKKLDRLWERVRKALSNLKMEPEVIEDLVGRRDVKLLAEIVGARS
jgi:hypothetical protein